MPIADLPLFELKEELRRTITAGYRERGEPFDKVNKVWRHELEGAIAYLERRGLTGTLNEAFDKARLKNKLSKGAN